MIEQYLTTVRPAHEQFIEPSKRFADDWGVSIDSTYAHEAWTKGSLGPVGFPLVSDTTHQLSRSYGVLIEKEGIALRATVLIDPEGVVRSYAVNDLGVGCDCIQQERAVTLCRLTLHAQ